MANPDKLFKKQYSSFNLPLQPGADFAAYRQAFVKHVVPKLDVFEPDFILLSSGFDASKDDPLAQMNLSPSNFGWITNLMKQAAATHCQGRLISVLEGGYDLRSLAECAAAHVESLLDDADEDSMMKMKSGF